MVSGSAEALLKTVPKPLSPMPLPSYSFLPSMFGQHVVLVNSAERKYSAPGEKMLHPPQKETPPSPLVGCFPQLGGRPSRYAVTGQRKEGTAEVF